MRLRIKEACNDAGTTQKKLAAEIGVSEVTLSRAVQGKTSLDLLERIAERLGVGVSSLFDDGDGIFVAVVHENGETYTFNNKEELRRYVDDTQGDGKTI